MGPPGGPAESEHRAKPRRPYREAPSVRAVLTRLEQQGYERMSKILADSACGKKLAHWFKKSFDLILEVVKIKRVVWVSVGPPGDCAHVEESRAMSERLPE